MDGVQSIVDEPSSLEWPVIDPSFAADPTVEDTVEEPAEASDESLWTRSRDFDWGD